MVDAITLCLDDSGTRNSDKNPRAPAAHGHDWFGLGGMMVQQGAAEEELRSLHKKFFERWPQLDPETTPLHSHEIRNNKKNFTFLGTLSEAERNRFMDDLTQVLISLPVLGIACVIDRPCYNARYAELYGGDKWMLCKTAFSIVVERAAKYAIEQECKLRVWVEAGDLTADRMIKDYYSSLKSEGMPFLGEGAGQYGPLEAEQFQSVLYELRFNNKSSPLMQIADLYLWPMCIGGYDEQNRAYQALKSNGRLIDCTLDAEILPSRGIKYSCFDFEQ